MRAVTPAKAQAPVGLVYPHWGDEGVACPTGAQTRLAKKLAGAGATAVLFRIDDGDPSVRLQRSRGVAQQRDAPLDLVVGLDDQHDVDGPFRQFRIVGRPEARDDVAQVLALHAP